MDRSQIQNMLLQTFEDYQMTRSERAALNQIFSHITLTNHNLALVRKEAFEIFREHKPAHLPDEKSLSWLEDVMKILANTKSREPDLKSEALFSPRDDCSHRICRLIDSARKQIDICVFTITDDRVTRTIQDAHKRKVKVRIISDNDKSYDLGSDIEQLSRSGIPVRIDKTEYHMHHKFALFDSEFILTGSYNWTRSASKNNSENLIITNDPALLIRFASEFEKLWDEFEE
ncbi:phospholipase D-like domain-containing protein [uncultured Gimesia sp.]|uniref:phospholipase D-like domain-containing protein n=1 Tax=uncultured Gimesia sp. TaxID=1678688 RepID=UPI0030D8C744|tara:strand:+ start:124042 stop:124734 length:693 start_codon:yes stop_codon:yes gene_type:complete